VSIDRLPLGTVAAVEFVPVLALFAVYIVLADRVAKRPEVSGIDGLAAAMLVAAVAVTPFFWDASAGLRGPRRAPGRDRGWGLLVRDPVRLRPARAPARSCRPGARRPVSRSSSRVSLCTDRLRHHG
jgi:hypothetical protein